MRKSAVRTGAVALLGLALLPLPLLAQPSAPTGLVATGDHERVHLDWADNTETNLAGYGVDRALTSGGPYARLDRSVPLVGAGSVWRYQDLGVPPGEGWRDPGFNDAPWAFGPAPLGSVPADAATLLHPGLLPTNAHPASYFRHAFAVGDPAVFTQLELLLRKDDGAAVYLNGVELVRDNLPEGTLTPQTFATAPVTGTAQERFCQFLLPPAALVAGTNCLAVEVHQSGSSDADVRFDLRLAGIMRSNRHSLAPVPISAGTTAKPQSKLWRHRDTWWAVLPDSSGTWVWRLDQTLWRKSLKLSSKTAVRADCKAQGEVTHVLLFDGVSSHLASIEYVAGSPGGYRLWPARPQLVPVLLTSGAETATLDVDSRDRMWVASDSAQDIEVRYSDWPYTNWSAPHVLASRVALDDICVITALPNGTMGVLWSDQVSQRFGFRLHRDTDDPLLWSADEVPASQSATNVGLGMADDHLNVAVGSDGTLYAAVKTSYDTNGFPKIALLVRRPDGRWDPLYDVDSAGTRPLAILDEDLGLLRVIYTSHESAGDIVCKETAVTRIVFGQRQRLLPGGLNDVTSTKQNVHGDLLVLASGSGLASGVRLLNGFGADPLSSRFVDYQVNPGQAHYYRVTAESGQSSSPSAEVSATPLPGLPNGQPISLLIDPGSSSGSLDALFDQDGRFQSLTEASTGPKGRSGFLAEYVLTSAVPANETVGVTLLCAGSWASADAAEATVAQIWNVRSSSWDLLDWTIGATLTRLETSLEPRLADYLAASGLLRLRFRDSADLEREKKDTLAIDLLAARVRRGPLPPGALQALPGDSLVSLTWAPSPHPSVVAYDIERNGIRIASVGAQTTFVDSARANGVSCTYAVKAVGPVGERSRSSPSASATPERSLPPCAPYGVSASLASNHVVVTWAGNLELNVASYQIYRGTSAPVIVGPQNLLAQVPHTLAGAPHRFEDRSLNPGLPATCHYVLTATDLDGQASPPTPPSDAARVFVPVNQPPSFSPGPDQVVSSDAGPQTIADWARLISPGPYAFETNQQVSFVLSNNLRALFTNQPAIATSGTLTFAPAPGTSGVAVVTVIARDNGGTAFGGRNTALPVTFSITTRLPDCPQATGQTLRLVRDTTQRITLAADRFTSGLQFAIVVPPLHGSLGGMPPELTYTPAAGYLGMDSFTFQVQGPGCVARTPAVVGITVEEYPRLFLEPTDAGRQEFRLRWWPDLPGFRLQTSDAPNGSWTNAESGGTNPVSVDSGTGPARRFYRLIQP